MRGAAEFAVALFIVGSLAMGAVVAASYPEFQAGLRAAANSAAYADRHAERLRNGKP